MKPVLLIIIASSLLLTGSSHQINSPLLSPSQQLAETINEYRASKGLPRVAVSPLLNEVAQLHVEDLENNSPDRGECNMHSWSKSKQWSSCCYTDNHSNVSCMWDKPREITNNRYSGNGYEIAAWSSNTITPSYALDLWKKSKGHHDVILNRGIWNRATWRSIGVAMSDHYAVVWFGEI